MFQGRLSDVEELALHDKY